MNIKCALIGRKLGHSYSKIIHKYLGEYSYDLVELEPNELENFIKSKNYQAFNVTIPYKVDVIQHLDKISERAEKIGAVNTVYCRDGLIFGDNTDFSGMVYALNRANIKIENKKVMILGSGGTSNTAVAVCTSLCAKEIVVVSRKGEINYSNYYLHSDTDVIINTTPVGMFPNTDDSPITLDAFKNLSGVFDVVYNPSLTKLLYYAKSRGINYSNGLPMLVAQAKYASELFTGKVVSDTIIEKILLDFEKKNQNIVLIGMPGSGKSTIGKMLSELLNKELIDTDKEIEKECNLSIPEIFDKYGEEYFREIETLVTKRCGALSGKIISTGGGIVKNKENLFYLKQNGTIFFIDREITKLARDGRPLSKDLNALENLYAERINLYREFSDVYVDNNQSLDVTIKGVIDKL